MGLHTGEPIMGGERYVGLAVHRAARICASAVGGEILISRVTAGLVDESLPAGIELREVGERALKGFDHPEQLFAVRSSDLPVERPRRSPDEIAISLLGPLEVSHAGKHVDLGTPQQRALVAFLALRSGVLVPVDAIVDTLWPEVPPPSAEKIVQTYISRLRKVLGPDLIRRRGSGYVLDLPREALDLARFERLAAEDRLDEALALWRGPALGDLANVRGLRVDAERLEEMRLRALEMRIDADIEAGRDRDVVPELRALVAAHPLRERLRHLLMLALYRSGRQAEALECYAEARQLLVGELGLEPSERLHDLHAAILRHDSDLMLAPSEKVAASPRATGTVLVWRAWNETLVDCVALAEKLAAGRELIVADVVPPGADVRASASELESLRVKLAERGVRVRAIAFTSAAPGVDAARLAREQDAVVAVVPCPRSLLAHGIPPSALAEAFLHTPCDVAVLASRRRDRNKAVMVPFGGAEDDWAAVELGAWAAASTDAKLQLVGSEGGAATRDASRTLATASLLLQRHLGVSAEPILATPGAEGMLAAVAEADLVVAGIPNNWEEEGIGATRQALVRDAVAAVMLVRRGDRPGGLAPSRAVTRFSWSRAR